MSNAEATNDVPLADQVREANGRLAAGDTEGALAILERMTEDGSIYVPAHFLLSMTAWKMGQLDWAIALMRQCYDVAPMDGTVAETLASLYAQAGDLRESLFMGKMATALGGPGELLPFIPKGFPNFDFAFYTIKEKPLFTAARTHFENGRLTEAIEKARQHVTLNPEDGDARAFLATLLLRLGRGSAAVDVMHAMEGHIIGGGEFPPVYASLYARALATVGDAAAARAWHEKATSAASEDGAIAAASIADGIWLERSPGELAAAARDWARRFCVQPTPRSWKRPDGKLVIGYHVPDVVDPADLAAVAAVARAHNRDRVTVVGYGSGAQTWEVNAPLRGAFDSWHDVSNLDSATLARFFTRGGLHLIIDAAGFAAPRGLMALARVQTAIRAAWLGNAAALGEPVYDVQIAARSAELTGPTAWRVGGGYPVLPEVRPTPSGVVRENAHFGADISMAQLDPETVGLWSSVLQALPEAKLLLRAHDMGLGGNIERLVARFGRELAARIDVVDAVSTAEFYRLLDVALLPCRGVSPRFAAEALSCGVPAVAPAGNSAVEPYAPFLRDFGLSSMLVAADDQEYVSLAAAIATPGKSRTQVVEAMTKAAGTEDAHRFAEALETYLTAALEGGEGTPS